MPSLQQIMQSLNSLFSWSKTHAHTGTDSQKISYNNLINLPEASSTSFGGIVASTGTGRLLPSGWSSLKTGTGNYTITHNLGLTSTTYAVVATLAGGGTGFVEIDAQSANSFNVDTFSSTSSLTDHQFNFVVIVG